MELQILVSYASFSFSALALLAGICVFRRLYSGPGWWLMLVGVIGSTLGMAGSFCFQHQMMEVMNSTPSGHTSLEFARIQRWLNYSGYFFLSGLVVFAVGFVYSGFKLRRIVERNNELESLVLSQQARLSELE